MAHRPQRKRREHMQLGADRLYCLNDSYNALGTPISTVTFLSESLTSVLDDPPNFDDCGLLPLPAARKLGLGRAYKARWLMMAATLGTWSCFAWTTTAPVAVTNEHRAIGHTPCICPGPAFEFEAKSWARSRGTARFLKSNTSAYPPLPLHLMSSLPANEHIGANWSTYPKSSPPVQPLIDIRQPGRTYSSGTHAGEKLRWTLGTGQIDGEGIKRHWGDFRARHLLSMSGSETPDDPDDSDDSPPPLEAPIPPEDPSMAPPGGIVRAGVHTRRVHPLIANDLYEGTTRPDALTNEHMYQQCGICLHIKSHPVSYRCGHSNCYVCIRLWLENDWRCPECLTVMCERPFRHYAEEQTLTESFPTWDQSKVKYSWEGLRFPLCVEAEDDDDLL
ncbi:hypothetical protein B0H14DRAFT_2609189 [Mycena olivaceomarginata]|nr:hypothetical protein B0H14DRAFT_2609189 [Mycena olivaceomarginata]